MTFAFNFYEYFIKNIDAILLNLIATFLGAFLGFLFALWINNHNNKKSTIKELHFKKQQYYNRVLYLSLYLDAIKKYSIEQLSEMIKHSENIKSSPLKYCEPAVIASNELELLKNMNSSELFQSYMYFFLRSDEEGKNYNKLFLNIDYLGRIYSDYEKMNFRHQEFLYKETKEVLGCLSGILLKIALHEVKLMKLNKIEFQHSPEIIYFQHFKNIAIEMNGKELDFEKANNLIFLPLLNTLIDNVDDETLINEIFTLAKRGTDILKITKANAIRFAEACISDKSEISIAIDIIDNFNKNLKTLNSPN